MDYRKEHSIGKRLRARKTLWPYTFPLSRKKNFNAIVSKDSSSSESSSSVESSPKQECQKSLTEYVSEQLLDEIEQMHKRPQINERKGNQSALEDSVVTFKRHSTEDLEVTFKMEHDPVSSGESQISTRPNSEKSVELNTPEDYVGDTKLRRKIKTEHIDDEISFTEVISESSIDEHSTLSSVSIVSVKKDRSRAASLDARVRTMLLLEKQKPVLSNLRNPQNDTTCLEETSKSKEKFETLIEEPIFVNESVSVALDNPKTFPKTEQWYDSCFASNSKTLKTIRKSKEKSLKDLQEIERSKIRKRKKQCQGCMKMLKYLLVKTSQELLEQMGHSKKKIKHKQAKSARNAICEKCQSNKEPSESEGMEKAVKCQVKLTKLSNEVLERSSNVQTESGKMKLVLKNCDTPGLSSRPKISPVSSFSSWQFEGEPFNKRIYCRHPDGLYKLAVRSCYDQVTNDDVTLSRGDCVLIAAQSRSQPFVAAISDLYICPISGGKMAHIYWFYGEEILACSRKLHERELMASKHADDIDLNCIDDKCFVLTRHQYSRYVADQLLRKDIRWLRRITRRPLSLNRFDPPVKPSSSYSVQKIPSLDKLNEADPELIFWCNKVFDLQRKQILKNPH
ncbi:uncharacterized protein LOC134846358 isoform X2 [Symsagittifera roscoffensis]|uniref:uncharacterized protein LOC134846358 isoform X2 n=1 Tax=Symsagittifera roscoffensis TaxID=84072 RepID=UPI00307B31E2